MSEHDTTPEAGADDPLATLRAERDQYFEAFEALRRGTQALLDAVKARDWLKASVVAAEMTETEAARKRLVLDRDGTIRATGWAVDLLSQSLYEWLDALGAENNCQWRFSNKTDPQGRELTLTAQWSHGKTPMEMRAEALAEVARLREALAEAEARHREHGAYIQLGGFRVGLDTAAAWLDQRAQARTDKDLVKRGLTVAHGKPKFLLAGLARCAVCGGPIRALHRRRNKTTIRVYGCAWRDERGPAVCTNSTRRPVEACEDAILQWFRNHVLDDTAVAYVLHRAQALLAEERTKGEDPTLALAAELAEVEREVARLTQAVVAGAGAVQTIVEALTARDRRAKELRAEIARVRAESAEPLPDWPEALHDLRARLASLREEFRKGVDEAREVLRRFLVGPILFAPVVFGPRHHRFQITGKALGGRGLLASLEAPDQSPSTARGTSTTRAVVETQAFLMAA